MISHHLVSLGLGFRDRTYINRPLSYQFKFGFLGSYLYRLDIFLSSFVRFQFLRPHLYRSVIILSVELNFVHLRVLPA